MTEWFNVLDFRSSGCARTFVSPNLTSSARPCSLVRTGLWSHAPGNLGSNPNTAAKSFRIIERGKNQPSQVDDMDPFQYSTKTELSFFPYKLLFPTILIHLKASCKFLSFIFFILPWFIPIWTFTSGADSRYILCVSWHPFMSTSFTTEALNFKSYHLRHIIHGIYLCSI